MEDNFGRTKQLRGSSLPVQELEEGFDDWVGELRSILQTPKRPLAILYGRKRTNQKREHTGDAEPRSDEENVVQPQKVCLEQHR